MALRLTYLGSMLLAVVILCAGFIPAISTDDAPVTDEYQAQSPPLPLQIGEFSYASQENNRIVRVLEAHQLFVQPRRFMVFNIKSVNEAILQNVHLKRFFYETHAAPIPLFDVLEVMPLEEGRRSRSQSGSELGLVTRFIAKRIRFDVFREEVHFLALAAEYGLQEQKESGVEFTNAILRDMRSNRLIRSSKILWDEERKRFIVPGDYTLTASGTSVSGGSIEIDLDFHITQRTS